MLIIADPTMTVIADPSMTVIADPSMTVIADPSMTVICRTAIRVLCLYFNLCKSVKLDSFPCSFTSISFLTTSCFFTLICV